MITGSQAIIAFLEATSNEGEFPYIIVGGSMEVVRSVGRPVGLRNHASAGGIFIAFGSEWQATASGASLPVIARTPIHRGTWQSPG